MTAASSPSPVELFSSMRNAGHSTAASAAALDLYCGSSRGGASSASTKPSASDGCLGDVTTPRCSPGASPGVTPVDLHASMTGAAAAAVDAAALRLMLSGGRHLQTPHHGGLPPLPVLGVGSPMSAIGNQPQNLRHPHHLEASAFYLPPNLQMAAELAAAPDAWNGLYNSTMGLAAYDTRAAADYQSYLQCYGGLHDVRRKNATRESTSTLKSWLIQHIKNPYPTKGEKIMLAIITKMTLTQVSTWFANARRRLKKENKMQWSPRQRTGDDDDDDVDEDDSPNDVTNGSFSVSDDECSNDIIVDDRGFGGCRSPHTRLAGDDAVTDDSNDHVTFDQHVTSSDAECRRLSLSHLSQRHQQNRETVDGDKFPPPSSSSSSQAFDAQHTAAERNGADAVNDNQVPASKPRIWSIAELATSGNDRRKFNPTTTTTTTDNEQRRSPTTTSSSSPTPRSPPDVAIDYRSWAGAAVASATGLDDAIPLIYRKQFHDTQPSPSSGGGEQLLFPVAAVEAFRWQMAAAACRAATAAAAAAAAASRSSSRRFEGAVSNATADGSCASTLSISALR